MVITRDRRVSTGGDTTTRSCPDPYGSPRSNNTGPSSHFSEENCSHQVVIYSSPASSSQDGGRFVLTIFVLTPTGW